MSGIFDRLQRQLDIRKREEGISPLEIADLPPNLRKVMRLMLREVVIKHTALVAAIEKMPPANRLSRAELDSALAELVEQNWLIRYGDTELGSVNEFTSYKVNLRRKAGSQLDQDIWSALDARILSEKKGRPPSG
jgi:hypothetical protein